MFTWDQIAWAVGIFCVTFALSMALVVVLLINLPERFLVDPHSHGFWSSAPPLLRWAAIIVKNLLGVGLIVVGLLLSIPGIPGQGFLTILAGIFLLDFPGKKKLERYLVSRPRVLGTINRIRSLFGVRPLVLE